MAGKAWAGFSGRSKRQRAKIWVPLNAADHGPYEIARRGIGIVPQGRRIFPSLTVLENLTLGMESGGLWNLGRVYELFPQLGERMRQRAQTLSGGE